MATCSTPQCLTPPQATCDPAGPAPQVKLKSSPRLTELDTLRGFLLVWMTFTHMPTRLSMYTNQAVGFVSAAEGFIFLAALLTAHIQVRAQARSGIAKANSGLFNRALRIYRYHLALLGVAFTVFASIAFYLHRTSLQNLMDYYLANPFKAVVQAIPLAYQPPLFDILPMYIIFMLMTPVVMAAARRWSWKVVLGASTLVWIGAQFGLRVWAHHALELAGLQIPLNQSGAFDLFGWQLLWISGLALGANGAIGFSSERFPRWLTWSAAGIAAVILFLRHSPMDQWVGPELFGYLVDKWHLAPLRIIDFAAIGILLSRWGGRLAHLPGMGLFSLLGRNSLEVFSAHILFCLATHAMSFDADPMFAGAQELLVLTSTIAGLLVIAYLAEQRRNGKKAAKPQVPQVQVSAAAA